MPNWKDAVFAVGLLACVPLAATPFAAPVALVAGCAVGAGIQPGWAREGRMASRLLLQASVVVLGLTLDFGQVVKAGAAGLGFTLVSVAAVLSLGWWLGRLLGVSPITRTLVSVGTAVCGGSAVVATAAALDAPGEDVTVALATVFVLNAVAMVVFPPLGHLFALSPSQFGVWAGIAVHDVASVVGAATTFDPASLPTATAVKLARVLYLVPVVAVVAACNRRKGVGQIGVPWFVGGFLAACFLATSVPALAPTAQVAKVLATAGFALSLYLIGAGLDRATLKAVGPRALALGGILWAVVAVATFFAARLGWA